MLHALKEIAPAVIHGGMSTLLAFILLAASDSYVFESFFKVIINFIKYCLHPLFLYISQKENINPF